MEVCKEGEYRGTLTDYGLTESKTGAVQVYLKIQVRADFQTGPKTVNMTWFSGFSSEKAATFTMKTLKALGMKSNNVQHLAQGANSLQLEIGQEVRVTIANEVNPTTNELQSKIRWVNPTAKPLRPVSPEKLSGLEWVTKIAESLEGGNKTPGLSEEDIAI